VTPFAAEAWAAVFGGLIPIVGLVAIGWLIVRAVRDTGDDDDVPGGP
jgi:flagellar biogenesis protein FliO